MGEKMKGADYCIITHERMRKEAEKMYYYGWARQSRPLSSSSSSPPFSPKCAMLIRKIVGRKRRGNEAAEGAGSPFLGLALHWLLAFSKIGFPPPSSSSFLFLCPFNPFHFHHSLFARNKPCLKSAGCGCPRELAHFGRLLLFPHRPNPLFVCTFSASPKGRMKKRWREEEEEEEEEMGRPKGTKTQMGNAGEGDQPARGQWPLLAIPAASAHR
jgi:hypothetical protein